jgi:hypothetical protein
MRHDANFNQLFIHWEASLTQGLGIRFYPTQRIHKPHLVDRRTRNLQQLGAGDDHRERPGTRDGHVEAILAVEKLDVSR